VLPHKQEVRFGGLFAQTGCRSRLGDKLGAIADFQKAVALDPQLAGHKIPGLLTWTNNDIVDGAVSEVAQVLTSVQGTMANVLRH
jgi:hypothetical protein